MNSVDPDATERIGLGRVQMLVWGGLAFVAVLVGVFHLAPAVNFRPIAAWLPSYQLEDSSTSYAEGGNLMTPAIALATRRIARAAPLEALPLYYGAIEREGQASDTDILHLLDEVVRRDPRHYYARVWRARLYYRIGRMPEAVDEILKVIPLNRSNERDYLEALVDIARDPKNQPLMLGLVSKEPVWAQAFVNRATTEIGDDAFSLALASRSQKSFSDYARALVRSGQYERAFLIWQSTLSEAELLSLQWPSDPNFKRIGDGSPFGWQPNNAMASQEPDGVHVFYNGRGAKTVLSQAMLLGGGYRYRFSALLSGEIKERGGWFRWRLTCVPSHAVLMEADVTSAGPEEEPTSAEFAVPDTECAAQSIELTAQPGEYPFQARLRVNEVRIDELAPVEEIAASPAAEARGTQ